MTTQEKEALLQNIYERGFQYEQKYGFCTQAVIGALQDFFAGIDNEVFKATHPLAGGGALCGDGTCGALVGGLAVVGSYFGRSRDEFAESDPDGWMNSSAIAKEIREKFLEEYGSVICNDIQTKKWAGVLICGIKKILKSLNELVPIKTSARMLQEKLLSGLLKY